MSQQPYKWMNFVDDSIVLLVKAVPNSSKNAIIDEDEYLKIKIKAPAVDNKANVAIIEYLAKMLKVSKSSIILKSGQTSKLKKIILPKDIGIDNVTKILS